MSVNGSGNPIGNSNASLHKIPPIKPAPKNNTETKTKQLMSEKKGQILPAKVSSTALQETSLGKRGPESSQSEAAQKKTKTETIVKAIPQSTVSSSNPLIQTNAKESWSIEESELNQYFDMWQNKKVFENLDQAAFDILKNEKTDISEEMEKDTPSNENPKEVLSNSTQITSTPSKPVELLDDLEKLTNPNTYQEWYTAARRVSIKIKEYVQVVKELQTSGQYLFYKAWLSEFKYKLSKQLPFLVQKEFLVSSSMKSKDEENGLSESEILARLLKNVVEQKRKADSAASTIQAALKLLSKMVEDAKHIIDCGEKVIDEKAIAKLASREVTSNKSVNKQSPEEAQQTLLDFIKAVHEVLTRGSIFSYVAKETPHYSALIKQEAISNIFKVFQQNLNASQDLFIKLKKNKSEKQLFKETLEFVKKVQWKANEATEKANSAFNDLSQTSIAQLIACIENILGIKS